jgi:acyl-CoA dehydrogenase
VSTAAAGPAVHQEADQSTIDMLVETVDRLMAELLDNDRVSAVEGGEWPEVLWAPVAAAELPWISVPEEAGGAGGDVEIAAALWRALGRAGASLPVGETALAGCILASAGCTIARDILTLAAGGTLDVRPSGADLVLGGRLRRVPWGRFASHVVTVADGPAGPVVLAIPVGDAEIVHGRNLAEEPRDDVVVEGVRLGPEHFCAAPPGIGLCTPTYAGALLRSQMMAGAASAALDRTLEYSSERHQFGKTIGSFQAVQHLIVAAASETALADVAARTAATAATTGAATMEIASARAVTGQAATVVSAKCHQAHGAIGMTREYPLQRWTRRLWSWRDEFGTTLTWRRVLARELTASEDTGLWPLVSADPRLDASRGRFGVDCGG